MASSRRLEALRSHLFHQSRRLRPRPVVASASTSVPSVAELRSRYGSPAADGVVLEGVNHAAWVCSDMERTLRFWCDVLGLRLSKTISLGGDGGSGGGGGGGQHFFMSAGQRAQASILALPRCDPPPTG